MSVDIRQLEAFRARLEDNLSEAEIDAFCRACVKELAARLLQKTIKRTPVGVYQEKGKTGGTLRRGWTAKTQQEAASGKSVAVNQFLNRVQITKTGSTYTLQIINPVEYAPYVEYGHRTRGGKGWVEGKEMLTTSESEIRNMAPAILNAKLNKWIREQIT